MTTKLPTITYKSVEPFIEGLKEAGRVALDGIFSYLLTEGVLNSIILLIFGERLPLGVIVIITGAVMSILKGWDKQLHLTGKIEGDDGKTKGLAQF